MLKEDALITAYILDGNGGGKQIGWEEIHTWEPKQGKLWVHLDYTARKARDWLLKESGLDKLTVRALCVEESRPRSVISEKGLLVFLRGVNLNPGQKPEDMVSIRIWLDEQRIITTRKRRLLFIDDMRHALEAGHGPKTPSEFFISLNDSLIDHMANVLTTLDDRVDELEHAVITEESRLLRPKISDVRRQAILIHRYLAPQREALYRLQVEETPLLSSIDRLHIREATDRIVRYIEDLDSARDRAAITQEELTSRLTELMDHRIYILSVVAVLFLPLTFLTGLLGMNVSGIPGSNHPSAFTVVCAVLVLITSLILWVLKRKKWM